MFLGVVEPLSAASEDNIFFARRPFVYYLVQSQKFVIIFNGRLVRPKASQKIPPKMSSPTKKDNNIGNTKLDFYNGIGNVNRFMSNGQVSLGNNQGIGMKPNAIHTYGQNPSQQALAQIPGQIGQVNGFNPNRYPVPERPQLIYGQNIGSNIRHEQQNVHRLSSPQNYEEHSPVDRFSSDGYSTVQSQSHPSNNRGIQRPQNQQQPLPQNNYYPQYET